MNELRWILLAAGVVLIAALYLWGMRSRWAGRRDAESTRRAGVAHAAGAAYAGDPVDAPAPDAADEPAALRSESRRIEPSLGGDVLDADLDDDDDRAAMSRRASILDDEEELERPAVTRREPTFAAGRAEPAMASPRQEPTLQPEPTIQRRIEPTVAATPEPPKRPAQKILAIRVTSLAPSRISGAALLEALQSEGLNYGRYEIFHRLHDDGRPVFSVASLKEPGTFDLAAMPETQYPGVALFTVLPGPVAAADAFDEMIFSARALATHLDGALADERGAPLTALRVGKLREEALDFERGLGSA